MYIIMSKQEFKMVNKKVEKHISHHHHHDVDITKANVNRLIFSFVINILLSVVEIVGGIVSGSNALIGDALHNTSDAFSILVAVIAFKIGGKNANEKFTYGFKRAETLGGFFNLVLLFISGIYLLFESVEGFFFPSQIDGNMIISISILALIIDTMTAKFSHSGAEANSNMKMVFLHNLSDALNSVAVIVSGIFVSYFGIYWVDNLIALFIAIYMIYQAVVSSPKIIKILMNAVPEDIDLNEVKDVISQIGGVCDVHHLHLWSLNEKDISLECHIVSKDKDVVKKVIKLLNEMYGISHIYVQTEDVDDCCCKCCL